MMFDHRIEDQVSHLAKGELKSEWKAPQWRKSNLFANGVQDIPPLPTWEKHAEFCIRADILTWNSLRLECPS